MDDYKLMKMGELYKFGSEEITKKYISCKKLLTAFNKTKFEDYKKREKIAKKMLGKLGENSTINKPFYCDYGKHIFIGDNFYCNFDCTMLDVCDIKIGNNVFLAPKVSIFTAGHPIDSKVRGEGLEFGKEIKIGNDVWIGGNSVILPGVTIGDNVVIGAGSVVNKDIPSNCIAVGNPCRVKREITLDDKTFWESEREKYFKAKNS